MLMIKYENLLVLSCSIDQEGKGTKLIKLNDNFILQTIILIDIDSVKFCCLSMVWDTFIDKMFKSFCGS